MDEGWDIKRRIIQGFISNSVSYRHMWLELERLLDKYGYDSREHKKWLKVEKELYNQDVMYRKLLNIHIPDACPLQNPMDCNHCEGKIPNGDGTTTPCVLKHKATNVEISNLQMVVSKCK